MFKLWGSDEDQISYLLIEEDGQYGVTVRAVNKDGSEIGGARLVSFLPNGKLKRWVEIHEDVKGISRTEDGRIELKEE